MGIETVRRLNCPNALGMGISVSIEYKYSTRNCQIAVGAVNTKLLLKLPIETSP